ncbi:uncharacterized protein A4U43_C04F25250 [Asparagus officinalis]|uniref:Uncharacterized protein n=1 Tax=Asparagus officinalis TaxID=4686 RepID=A0A5P1F3K5_ASPOF|nr:uncharacterized protein A4U43_C04F25250 [Asparagus officinalis]
MSKLEPMESNAGAASHAGEIEHLNVLPHPVPIHDPRRQRGREAEHGHIEDQGVYVRGREARPGEESIEGPEEALVHLQQGVAVGRAILPPLDDVAGAVGVLSDVGADDDSQEEAVLFEAEALVAADDGLAELRGDFAVVGGPEVDVVDEVAPPVSPLIEELV